MFALSIWFGGLNAYQFDAIQRQVSRDPGLTKARHFAADGPMEEGWQAFELWETQPDYQRYLSAIRDVLQELGYPVKLSSWSWPIRQLSSTLPPQPSLLPESTP